MIDRGEVRKTCQCSRATSQSDGSYLQSSCTESNQSVSEFGEIRDGVTGRRYRCRNRSPSISQTCNSRARAIKGILSAAQIVVSRRKAIETDGDTVESRSDIIHLRVCEKAVGDHRDAKAALVRVINQRH